MDPPRAEDEMNGERDTDARHAVGFALCRMERSPNHREEGVMGLRIGAAAFLLLTLSTIASAQSAPQGTVDLDAPGALGALQQSNPAHYLKVRTILTDVLLRQDAEVPRWLQASFNARDISYQPIVLTSHPPKRRLSFALDDTRYVALITLTNVKGTVVPLK